MSKWFPMIVLAVLLVASIPTLAQPSVGGVSLAPQEALATVRINAPSMRSTPAGGSVMLPGQIDIAPTWVLYSPAPGDGPIPLVLTISPEGLLAGEVRWSPPQPHVTPVGDGKTETYQVYDDQARFEIPLRVPDDAEGTVTVTIHISGQVCSDETLQCAQVDETRQVLLRVGPAEADPGYRSMEDGVTLTQLGAQDNPGWSLWTGLAAALLAGLVLNIMPCVLPILPIRILTIVEAAGGSRRRYVTLGLSYAAGMMLFFLALAALNAGLQIALGRSLQWGEHFQYPWLRTVMAMLMVVIACNFFGLFNVLVPRKVASLDVGATGKAGEHWGVLGMGLMTAVLATPCSFAFLVVVLAWAVVQPVWVGVVAFVAMGVGMAAPHALLTAFPKLVDHLPKPGRWMELLRQAAGFAMVAVAVWLISTLAEADRVFRVGLFAAALAMGLWVWGTVVTYAMPLAKKLGVRLVTVAVVVALGMWLLPAPKELAVTFEPYSDARLAEVREGGDVALVKFTATWCTACRVIDARIYNSQAIADFLSERGVVSLKADVSNKETPAARFLNLLGGSPPLTVIYPPEGEPVFLLGEFHKKELEDAVERALR